ncbi:MAG: aromatic ring-hydroxylating dioxygenase subunit alpha [Actinomycetes bacterium]
MTTSPTTEFPIASAPLDPAELDRALRPFGQSTMLPAAAYTDPAVLAWERRHFFGDSWPCLGRVDDLAKDAAGGPLSQRALNLGDIPVLLTFEADAQAGDTTTVRAFANTCRHRGHELLPEGGTGSRRALTCPYHAWSYDLAGHAIASPGFDTVPTFDRSEYGLVELPSRVWHGWVFVNATARAGSFEQHIGELDGLVAPYAPERLVLGARHAYEIAANWKIVCENYHECYHCPMIHPELCQVSPPTSGANYDLPGAWVGGAMDLAEDAVTMSLTGASDGLFLEGVDPRKVLYLGLFPNLLLSLHPDYVMTHRMLPLAPDRTWIECSWYFPSESVDPSYAVDFWDLTNKQDFGACESVQRGLTSPHFKPGPFAPNEDAVHRWVSLVGRAYRGIPPHQPA